MTDVFIQYQDETHLRVIAEPSIKQELSSHFEFYVPGYKFIPAYRNKMWDGKIRLFNAMTGTIYTGLLPRVTKFLEDLNYTYTLDDKFRATAKPDNDYGYQLAKQYNCKFEPREYQNEAVIHALSNRRCFLLSPTASGKSLVIYLLTRHHISKQRRILLIVPTTSLVWQMNTDFKDYNRGDLDFGVHMIMEGAEKNSKADVVISTWQSIYKQPRVWFEQFDVVIGDEAHQYKAKSLMSIMEKCPKVQYRYGFSGTLDDAKTHRLTLEGLFGPVYTVTKTKDLIDDNTLSDFKIRALVLKYSDEQKKLNRGRTYHEEIDWLVSNEKRNKFIRNLAWKLSGNTLILFQFVEKHGKILAPMLEKDGKTVHFIHGGVQSEIREQVRGDTEQSEDNIILASFGTFSTGINIKRLDNLIFASPSKSKIRNLQSIGRVLRKSDHGDLATLYDIVDDLTWKSYDNFAVRHFKERVGIYTQEQFNFQLHNIDFS